MQRGKIRIVDDTFVITCPPHVAIRLRRLFAGAHRKSAGVFHISAKPETAYDLAWFRDRHPLDLESDCEVKFDKLVAAHERRIDQLAEIERTNYVPPDFELAMPPREYQRFAAGLAVTTKQLLIADQLGLGKTITAICTLVAPNALPAVIVTMTHLPRQWERELSRFAPNLRVHRIRSGQPYKFEDVKWEVGADGVRRRVKPGLPDVIVVNYHKLDGWVETLAGMVKTVVFDECQELRIDGSIKYRAASAIAEAARVRIGLSATPVYNYGSEIYTILNVLAPGALGTYNEFTSEWCSGRAPEGSDTRKVCVTDPAALGTYLRETGLMIRRTRKDVGRELPALTVVRHVVEVDPRRINEAAADVAELAQRVLDRTGTSFELMKWSGEIDYRMRQATGIGKAPAVADFVRLLVESGERVVLFGWHREVYSIWQSAFSRVGYEIPYVMYTGTESESEKVSSFKRFVEGDAKVIIISLRSGAGLDGLQFVSRTVVVGELDWSPAVMHQDIGRVHRDGQTEPVMAYYLTADEGSDPVIADVLGIKDAQSSGIIDPDKVGSPQLVGSSVAHIRRLAEDVLKRRSTKEKRSEPQVVVGDPALLATGLLSESGLTLPGDVRAGDCEATEAAGPATGNDDPRGAGDSRSAGPPEQDAGVLVWDLGVPLSHGQ